MNRPVLAAPILEKPLILYIFAQERSIGALFAQENDESKENTLYYLSQMMISNKLNYSPVKKLCMAIIFAIQKLKHFFKHTLSDSYPSLIPLSMSWQNLYYLTGLQDGTFSFNNLKLFIYLQMLSKNKYWQTF